MKKRYGWKPGFQAKGVKAAAAAAELEAIKKRRGRLKAELVVEEAKSKSSPLHKMFEWSDSEAAKRYRIDQARSLIRCLVVTVETVEEGKPIEVRAWVNVGRKAQHEKGNGRSYVRIEEAVADADMGAQLVQEARDELVGWRDRYSVYATMTGAVAKVGDAINSLNKLAGAA